MRARVRVWARVCVCGRVWVRVRACVRACVCVCACVVRVCGESVPTKARLCFSAATVELPTGPPVQGD